MPLTTEQTATLAAAVDGYAFPAALKDFVTGQRIQGLTMADVEKRIYEQLRSGNPTSVRDGLANVLHWGFAQMGGLADVRTKAFISRVTVAQLQASSALFLENPRPSLLEIKALGLPQFSAISFVSKVRMFLDPVGSATLDKQILKMKYALPGTVLDYVAATPVDTTIRLTQRNCVAYDHWCSRLDAIRRTYCPVRRVVDIERGFFHLVQTNQVVQAATILRDA